MHGLTVHVKIKEHFLGARQNDTTKLKKAGLAYIPLNPLVEHLEPPLMGNHKSERGTQHPMIAKMLCPARLIKDFEANPTESVRLGSLIVNS